MAWNEIKILMKAVTITFLFPLATIVISVILPIFGERIERDSFRPIYILLGHLNLDTD